MASKALLLPHARPRLLYQSNHRRRKVEVHVTPCLVTYPLGEVLINPSNPRLSGVADFSYFPRGGPVPEQAPSVHLHHIMPYVSSWGGMDVSQGLLSGEAVLDGLVHQRGGWRLRLECWKRRWFRKEPCPVGEAVATTGGDLGYSRVIHTTPPFYRDDDAVPMLRQCYRSALRLVNEERVACPLIEAGCRGFPEGFALDTAAIAAKEWLTSSAEGAQTLAFGFLSEELGSSFVTRMET